jgi:hypothetical protein
VDEETATLILSSYRDSHGTMVTIDELGTTVTWDEYFFWLCWYYADQDVVELQKTLFAGAPVEPVLSMLRVLHDPTEEANLIPDAAPAVPAETAAPTVPDEPNEPEEPENEAETNAAVDTDTETQPATESAETEAATEPAETVPSVTVSDIKTVITESARGSYEANREYAERLLLLRELFGEDFRLDFGHHAGLVESFGHVADQQGVVAVNEHILKHYSTIPGASMIQFEETGLEVTWDEYVFWECWVLAKDGITAIDETTFSNDLHEEVTEILFLIHQLVDTEAYTEAMEAAVALAARMPVQVEETEPETTATEATATEESVSETAETETVETETAEPEATEPEVAEPTVLQTVALNVKAAFENAREIYSTIYEQVMR